MIAFSVTVLHGLAMCIPFSVFAVGTFWMRPRLWLHSLPPDIQLMAGPKTESELKQTKWLVVMVLLLLPGGSLASLYYATTSAQIDLSFLGALIHLYTVWVIVHLWDLVVIDLCHILFINTDSPPIPNTKGAKGYKDFAFHGRAFAKACVMTAIFVVPAALMSSVAI